MKKFFLVCSVLFAVNCGFLYSQIKSSNSDSESISRLKADLKFISDDLLEGRNASSTGEKIAARFLASELEKYNVKPYGDNGTYFQNFSVRTRRLKGSPSVTLKDLSGRDPETLIPGPDYIIDDSKIFESKYLDKEAEIVFAGYGITAEEYGYDDYKNIDVKNKIVLLLAGEPESDTPDFFKGKEMTQYSSGKLKAEIAEKNGAVGFMVLMPDNLVDRWFLYHSLMMTGDMKLIKDEYPPAGGLPYIMITPGCAEKIFRNESMPYNELLKIRTGSEKSKSVPLNKKIRFAFNSSEQIETIANVIGVIEGNDPELKKEFVVLSAHFDHVGIYNGKVCNGANDNGSGVVAVLEIAKRLAESKANKRSVLIALFTAEEKGLLGSHYFTENFDKIGSVVADINIDMCGKGDDNVINIIGADRTSTELAGIAEKANEAAVRMKLDASLSNTMNFQMSDHYPFALKKIPAFFFFDNYLVGLHGPDDEIQFVNFGKILKTVKVTEKIIENISNLDHRLIFDGKL